MIELFFFAKGPFNPPVQNPVGRLSKGQKMKNDHYTYRVTWTEEDNCYVGVCLEFPSLSWLDSTPELSLKGIRKLVSDVIQNMKKTGEKIPEPISGKKFSGKFIVRVPPEVHRRLTIEAAESRVSLNRLASAKLSL